MNLDHLRAIASRATQGHWRWANNGIDLRASGPRGETLFLPIKSSGTYGPDQDFITTFSPAVVIELLDAVAGSEVVIDPNAEVIAEAEELRRRLTVLEAPARQFAERISTLRKAMAEEGLDEDLIQATLVGLIGSGKLGVDWEVGQRG